MTLLSVTDLHVHYPSQGAPLRAVDGVSLDVAAGETVGLVGESGCGKSSLGRAVLRLGDRTSGRILFAGEDFGAAPEGRLRPFRRRLQMIFQDPYGSLNPRHSVGDILLAPLTVHGIGKREERWRRVHDMLDRVGLPRDAAHRFPHEFSGGQRQRIGIARALILEPELVVCDEPVSALDLSIQAQIINLLAAMKREMNLSMLFISHDLSVVRYVADRVLVMYLGRVVESGPHDRLWDHPQHPYTRALIDAVPDPARRRHASPLPGDLPSARDIPAGCRFHARCAIATDLCRSVDPPLRSVAPGHQTACHHAGHGLTASQSVREDP